MPIDNPTVIVQSNKRYQGAPVLDGQQKIVLEQTSHEQVEYERYIDVNLEETFVNERETSNVFRPSTKYNLIIKNKYSGSTVYQPYVDYLAYTKVNETTEKIVCNPGLTPIEWYGFPQYYEFDFIRTDNNQVGYTSGVNNHQIFINKSASTYNWTHYMTYPYSNDYTKTLYVHDPQTIATWTFQAQDGIPYLITSRINNLITFRCPMKHGLSTRQYVQLPFSYNGTDLFEVDSVGDGGSGSEEYIFNIFDIGYLTTNFNPGNTGNLKKVLDPVNSAETMSKYYVKVNKILTEVGDAILTKSGFEENIFNLKTQFEKVLSGGTPLQILTPPTCPRTSIVEGSQCYTLSFNRDIDISKIRDNQNRPINELYFTSVWKGYWGWTNKLREGYEFNMPLQNNAPSIYWDLNNGLSNTNIANISYTSNLGSGPFYYNSDLKKDDLLYGDFCEWNDFTQEERIVSRKVHKFTFNQNWFTQYDLFSLTNQLGYYYYPHNPVTIRVFSEYVEEGDANVVTGIPDWAFYSNSSNGFRWRDIYPYGYVDSSGLGVDYPFTNGKHYPFNTTIFRLFYEGIGQPDITQIQEPTEDECE
jgi:hypothetical protein